MASTTTQRRKAAPRSQEGVNIQFSSNNNSNNGQGMTTATPTTGAAAPIVATVKRNKYGTGPFDENWVNMDCCGLFCAAITYGLHGYGVYTVCLVLLPPWMSVIDEAGIRSMTIMGHFHRLAFTLVAVLAVAAHFKAMTTDPGAVPPDALPLEPKQQQQQNDIEQQNGEAGGGTGETDPMIKPPQRKGKRLCRRCNAFKPKRAHHCSVCKRCIIKMDHHCPWVNNCVGIGNHKYFLLFVFYTFVSCSYSFTLVIIRFFSCMGRHGGGHVRSHHMTCLDRPTQLLQILGLIVEAILFGLFTCCMIFDQAGVVMTKMTHIDRLKGGDDDSGTSIAGVIEVFGLNGNNRGRRSSDIITGGGTGGGGLPGNDGSRFRPDWLSPFAKACFPAGLHDEIMGFCRPCLGNSRGGMGGGGVNETELSSPQTMRQSVNAPGMVRSVTEIV